MAELHSTVRAVAERIPRWPRRWRPHGRNVVVLYHRLAVLTEPDPLGMVVDPDRFRRHMEMLAAHFEVVPATGVRIVGDRPRAAITFDDGYADNLSVAAPVLLELGLPATFFVTTDALRDQREFWWDELEHLVREAAPVERGVLRVRRRRLHLALENEAARRETLRRLVQILVAEHPVVVQRTIADLVEITGHIPAPCGAHRRLSEDDVRALAAEPSFQIGSHTSSHAALRPLSRHERTHELVASRRELARVLGDPPRLLAYPYGAPGTIARRNAAEAWRAGYSDAFVNVPGPTDGTDRLAVPRIAIGDREPSRFLAVLTQWRSR